MIEGEGISFSNVFTGPSLHRRERERGRETTFLVKGEFGTIMGNPIIALPAYKCELTVIITCDVSIHVQVSLSMYVASAMN